MSADAPTPADSGIEVLNLLDDLEFAGRRLHTRDLSIQMEGLRRLTRAFVDKPEAILQELVNAALDLCGADSAGISIEQANPTDENFYVWVATAGRYASFSNATLPRFPSACGICLERGRPQRFRVFQRFFDLMDIDAAVVTDGILLPWLVDEVRGTIWIMAHEKADAFDREDLAMMLVLSDFAAMAVRQLHQQCLQIKLAAAAAAASMANDLAHEINNPLQSLTNLVYLASQGTGDVPSLSQEISTSLDRLSRLVSKLLTLPIDTVRAQ